MKTVEQIKEFITNTRNEVQRKADNVKWRKDKFLDLYYHTEVEKLNEILEFIDSEEK